MGDMELSVQLLFEMLGHGLFSLDGESYVTLITRSLGLRTQEDDVDSTQEDLLAVLKVGLHYLITSHTA